MIIIFVTCTLSDDLGATTSDTPILYLRFSPLNARATTLIELTFWDSRAEGTGFFGVEQEPHQTCRQRRGRAPRSAEGECLVKLGARAFG
jgi:hypothetical protein